MPSRKSLFRRHSGWLAIPASLILFATGCQGHPSGIQAGNGNVESTVSNPDGDQARQKILSPDAEFVVLTFFDLYCLACQQSADNFNVLHQRLLQAFPEDIFQMQGVGIGDTAFELEVFQRKYKLTYESIPDPEKTFEKPFAVKGTPTVILIKKTSSEHIEIFRHEGRLRQSDIETLMMNIRH